MRRAGRSSTVPLAASLPRLMSMVLLLLVLGLIYTQAKRPQTWRWLANDADTHSADAPEAPIASGIPPVDEPIVPGPTDEDAAEAQQAQTQFSALADRSPLSAVDMPAYWRCLKWARAQSFAQLERRAQRDVLYTQLWEQPDKYRGKLVRLRLHVRRVLADDAPANSAGVERVFEAWGATDESKSHPYVVVFTELPPGMKTGAEIEEDRVFVGYFLKTMAYTASNKVRSAPLLAGRMMPQPVLAAAQPATEGGSYNWLLLTAALVLLAGTAVWRMVLRRPSRRPAAVTHSAEDDLAQWLGAEHASLTDEQSQHLDTNGKK